MSRVKERFDRALGRIGQQACLLRDGERLPFSASLQPRTGDSVYHDGPLGAGETKYYTLYASLEGAAGGLCPGDLVEYGGGRYQVRRVECRHLAGEAVYLWAVLRSVCTAL